MASVLDLVKHYQHSIEKYPNDEQKILKCIDKLFNLGVTVQHLQETGVGRTVNALRKEPGDVGQAARALVYKWKLMVAAEESDQETDQNIATTHNEYDHGDDSEGSAKKSNRKHMEYETAEMKKPKLEEISHKHINGDHSGHKRKYHSSEEEHDFKKSKHLNSNDNGYKVKTEVQITKEPSDSENDSQFDSSQSDSESDESQSSDEEIKHNVKIKKEKDDKKYESSVKHTQSVLTDKHNQKHDKSKESVVKYSKHNNTKHTEKTSPKQKTHSSHKYKSSEEKSHSSEKREKDHQSSEKHRNKDSASKDASRNMPDKHRSNSSEVQRSNSSDKHRSSSEKHKSSSNSDKNKSSGSDKHRSHSERSSEKRSLLKSDKHASDKEVAIDKYKTSESKSSNKEKHSSSSKEKSKHRDSSKDKEHSHKSDKKYSSSSDTNSKSSETKSGNDKNYDKSSKKSKHKSSSSPNKTSTSKSKEELPKKKSQSNSEDEDGIDCGSGASFAEALGMVTPSKRKKKLLPNNSMSPPNSFTEDLSPAALLSPSAKLAPLPSIEISALPEISPNYRPRPPPKFLPHFTDEDAINTGISSKNQRTKVYSGNKVIGKIPSLYEICVNVLQEHIDALEFTGGVPYEILKPVVDKATPQQLFMLEHYNPYLMEDTDHLWQKCCEKNFRNKKRQEMETWREMYMRCQEEQEIRLKSLTAHIKTVQEAKKAPIKQTKMAYVDSVVKPPRNVAKKQAQHGTAFAASASPAARVASLAAAPNILKGGRPAPVPSVSTTSSFKPKKAPLMQKALQLMRGRKR